MWGVIEALIGRASDEFLAVAFPFVIIAGIYVFSHLRVDKQGKRYWYSQKYEDLKRNKKQDKILDFIVDTRKELTNVDQRVCRTEIMDAISRGEDIRIVSDIYDKYKAMGGNSYIDRKYNDYYLYVQHRDDGGHEKFDGRSYE
jgi:hypothetical protein